MAMKPKLKTGDQINSWTVISGPHSYTGKKSRYLCRCVCGTEKEIITSSLTRGESKCCVNCSKFNKKHGQTGSRLYNIWKGIKSRCFNPESTPYDNYGGRGITVCEEWLEFKTFYTWSINNGYSEDLVLDRINGNKDYSPDNCQWVTIAQNNRNTSRTHLEIAFGETKCFQDWINDPRCEVHETTLRRRLQRGIPFEQALRQ